MLVLSSLFAWFIIVKLHSVRSRVDYDHFTCSVIPTPSYVQSCNKSEVFEEDMG